MTAATAPVRRAPVSRHLPPAPSVLRLWRIELRRSPMPLILPLIAVLFWFDSYRPSTTQVPLYPLVTFWNMGQGHTIIDTGPFVAGMAAWIGSRDGRRGVADLVTATPRPRWIAQLITWAATATWAVAAYLGCTGVMFAAYAYRGVQGEPPWWWVAASAVAVLAFSAAGFALGTLWPSRFVAAVAAFGGFLAMMLSSQTGFRDHSGWALILPTNSNGNFQTDSGLLYSWQPDLPIARMIFFAGIGVAVLGLAGLPAAAGTRRLRIAAAALAAAGVAVTGTGVSLAAAARLGPHGIVISALDDAASDQPFSYRPVCTSSGFRVCVNPAYRQYLTPAAAALAPAVAEVAGLPGVPVRAVQSPAVYDDADRQGGQLMTIGGTPPVLSVPLGAYSFLPGLTGFSSQRTPVSIFDQSMRLLFFRAFVGAARGPGDPAQQAVESALLERTGVPFTAQPGRLPTARHPSGQPTDPAVSVAQRFAALPQATRYTWLTTHLAALRAGRIPLEQVP